MANQPVRRPAIVVAQEYAQTSDRLAEIAQRRGWTDQEVRGFLLGRLAAERLAEELTP